MKADKNEFMIRHVNPYGFYIVHKTETTDSLEDPIFIYLRSDGTQGDSMMMGGGFCGYFKTEEAAVDFLTRWTLLNDFQRI